MNTPIISDLEIAIIRLDDFGCPVNEDGDYVLNPALVHAQVADGLTDVCLENGEVLKGTWLVQSREFKEFTLEAGNIKRLHCCLLIYVSQP